MPKGDRFKGKADPADGTTPVSNLLLEALAMAKLSGKEKGIVLYLWRMTYGWKGKRGRLKKRRITLKEWAKVLGTTETRASEIVAELAGKKVIIRESLGQGKGYEYSMNTQITEWNGKIIDASVLLKLVTLPESCNPSIILESTLPESCNPSLPESCNPSVPAKEILKKQLNKSPLQDVKTSSDFSSFKNQLGNGSNKVAVLVMAFKAYHTTAPKEDFDNCGNRIAGMLKQCSNDYDFLLEKIYQAGSKSITGSHLNYINGCLKTKHTTATPSVKPVNYQELK